MALFDAPERDGAHINFLVNDAVVNLRRRLVVELQTSDWQRVLEINLTGGLGHKVGSRKAN